MIKWLKKLFIGLLIGLPISFVSADYFYLNDPSTIYDWIWTNVFTLMNYANFDTEGVKVVQIQWRWTYPRLHTLFWNGSWLYHIVSCQWWYSCQNIHTSIKEQWFYTRYCETTYNNICSNLNLDISWFIDNPDYANPDRLYLKNEWDLQYFNMCFQYESLDKSICIYSDNTTEVLYNSLWLTNNPYITDMDSTFLSLLTNSPFTQWWSQNIPIPSSTWLDSYVYIEIWTWDIIDYFEKEKWYNPVMCFVWTTDLTSNYEDRVVYHEWTWYTIFDTYSKLFNVNYMSLNEVWTFVNNWHLNYLNWFVNWWNMNPESVPYNAIYNGPNDSYFEYWSWLSSPFLWNKAVYFFIWWYFWADTYQKDWQELLYYCYKFLWSQDKISNDWSSYNITDDHSSTYDENVAVYTRNKRAETTYYSWSREIVWQNRDWTPLDYFTWDDMSVSSFSDFFSQSFNKLKVSRWDMNYWDLWLWYIPNYIIFFLLAIVFFRFLSH